MIYKKFSKLSNNVGGEERGRNMKRAWSKPKLIILLRFRPEEAVLAFCKVDSAGAGNPTTDYPACYSADNQDCKIMGAS